MSDDDISSNIYIEGGNQLLKAFDDNGKHLVALPKLRLAVSFFSHQFLYLYMVLLIFFSSILHVLSFALTVLIAAVSRANCCLQGCLVS